MMITRRIFLLGSGALIAPTALANAVPQRREHQDLRILEANDVVLKIVGWSNGGDDANAVWITISPSWRTAWR
ncbi:hypothetical protein [Bradyrhizobium sp. CCGB01]|uniref:hypothetical protein n=1 Tax=Bradyrhizobium sp. CCGB01 TaxID=2949634 RepID=UPI0020B44D72|nr:hypothetical protein [Bradyrhizobium sp. CCGB01]MCP3408125.1 hypothetical protein [Bradyrhizobium sp. CCGB01]